MKPIEVQIMGQGYLLSCPPEGRDALLNAVGRVDSAMCKVRDAGKVKTRDRIAVLASLNLALELTELHSQHLQSLANLQAALASASAPATDTQSSGEAERWTELTRQLDAALALPIPGAGRPAADSA